ncbi:hypothetical protein ACRALDRAFT_2023120 [Sodiomyces alcalophilus JCM 7366]|uniref:uncharacterized protein n=1 Tax=Sodiomyces alcalophilus JCM 7366 TaxID=591952 RepID=UPI0039B41FCD
MTFSGDTVKGRMKDGKEGFDGVGRRPAGASGTGNGRAAMGMVKVHYRPRNHMGVLFLKLRGNYNRPNHLFVGRRDDTREAGVKTALRPGPIQAVYSPPSEELKRGRDSDPVIRVTVEKHTEYAIHFLLFCFGNNNSNNNNNNQENLHFPEILQAIAPKATLKTDTEEAGVKDQDGIVGYGRTSPSTAPRVAGSAPAGICIVLLELMVPMFMGHQLNPTVISRGPDRHRPDSNSTHAHPSHFTPSLERHRCTANITASHIVALSSQCPQCKHTWNELNYGVETEKARS